MPMSVTVVFHAANPTELIELINLAADNEPISVSVQGSFQFEWELSQRDVHGVYSDEVRHNAKRDEQDLTPPNGIARSEAFAKAAEAAQQRDRELVTAILYDELVVAAYEYRANQLDQDDYLAEVDCQARCVDNPQAMPPLPMTMTVLSCMRDLRYHITDDKEFCAVVHELGRDAWGSTLVPEPPL